MWPARVPGGEGEPDRAVAEEVVGAAEARVGVDLAAVEVDRAVVEGVVEVLAPVAVEQRFRARRVAAFHSASLTTKVDCGNSEIAELWSRCRWVMTTIGTSPGSRPAFAQLRRDVFAGLEARLAEARRRGAPKFSRAVGRDRGVQAGVDEDRAGARVAEQEGGAGDLHRRLAAEQGPRQLQRQEAAARALHHRARPGDVAGDHRFDRHRRARGALRRAARAAVSLRREPSSRASRYPRAGRL